MCSKLFCHVLPSPHQRYPPPPGGSFEVSRSRCKRFSVWEWNSSAVVQLPTTSAARARMPKGHSKTLAATHSDTSQENNPYIMIYWHIEYTYICIYEPGPRTPTPPPSPPQWYPPPLLTPPPPQNLVFACYLHIYIHIYTYILPFPPLHPRISTLFAALESHDLVNGPCLPVYFYHNLFFEPPIACLAHGLQHICYLWITQSLPMQT